MKRTEMGGLSGQFPRQVGGCRMWCTSRGTDLARNINRSPTITEGDAKFRMEDVRRGMLRC